MRILALADDLTGALEVGAQLAGNGIRAAVAVCWRDEPVEALVLDTETRHLDPARAAAVIFPLAAEARRRGIAFVYKKTDSTLRGNIGSELGALAAAWPGAALVYAPAYPRLGRTVRAGRLYVDGVPVSETAFASDALNPVSSSEVAEVVRSQCSIPVRLAGRAEIGIAGGPMILICDGESDDELRATAQTVHACGVPLAAGPAALAGHLARLWSGSYAAPKPPCVRRCIVVNGSRHAVSLGQIACAAESGWPTAAPETIAAAVERSGWVLLAAREGAEVRTALEQAPVDGLVVFGGDTAFGVLEALGRPVLYPWGEVLDGVPLARAGGLSLITKAGGFGAPDLLLRLRALLSV